MNKSNFCLFKIVIRQSDLMFSLLHHTVCLCLTVSHWLCLSVSVCLVCLRLPACLSVCLSSCPPAKANNVIVCTSLSFSSRIWWRQERSVKEMKNDSLENLCVINWGVDKVLCEGLLTSMHIFVLYCATEQALHIISSTASRLSAVWIKAELDFYKGWD